ncbi:MAG: acetolactate synthase small subunit [Firmicutes bacterium]|nr:acetolactate synthase small subunit [Bacillota bacterium]
MNRYTVVALVVNRPGVLAHISSLFNRRSFNIESITAGLTEDAGITRITMVVSGDLRDLDQVMRQLDKLIDVIKVVDLTERGTVDRELVLIKVNAGPEARAEIMQVAEVFRARIVDLSEDSLVVEMTGDSEKVEALIGLLSKFRIIEMARTGKISMLRGRAAVKTEQA